jgi:predicted metal-dependent hydrolase
MLSLLQKGGKGMYHRLYIEYLYYFNVKQDYYECHEVMEELWLNEGRNRLLQALLQVAVGLHHFRNGNLEGAIHLFEAALAKSTASWSGELGIDIEKLFTETREYLQKLYMYEQTSFPFYPLHISIIDPELKKAVAVCIPKGVLDEDKF